MLSEAERSALDTMLSSGTLATRITTALGTNPDRATMQRVYGQLADSLVSNQSFG